MEASSQMMRAMLWIHPPAGRVRLVLFALVVLHLKVAHADDATDGDNASHPAWKLTTSYYDNSDATHAYDVNLRADFADQRVWIGDYRDSSGYTQARAGFDAVKQIGILNLDFSGQAASGGFFGGSVNAQLGGDSYAMLGFGRTDLHPYYNLNFDPNDALTVGLGSKALSSGLEVQLFHIWDDRLPTHQHVTHLLLHYAMSQDQRFSLDASYKHGLDDSSVYVHGYALSATYAWRRIFARLAYDQHANFAEPTQTRLSVGALF